MGLLLTTVITTTLRASPCVHSYPNHTINHISNNINTQSDRAIASIYYLGKKASTDECKNSCLYFNYLCDKSSDDIVDSDSAYINFNSIDCIVTTIRRTDGIKNEAIVLLTPNLVANKYIIEVQLSVESGKYAGFYWKSNNNINIYNNNQYHDYYFYIDPLDFAGAAYTNGSYFTNLKQGSPSTRIEYDTTYNICVHINGNNFTTYFEGEAHFSGTMNADWNMSYSGIFSYDAHATFYSYKVIFPDALMDNQDENICAAYIYDNTDGDCYGYYGTNYTLIETSLAPDTNYDSAIINASTCAPEPHTTLTINGDPHKQTTTQLTPITSINEENASDKTEQRTIIFLAVIFATIFTVICVVACACYQTQPQKMDIHQVIQVRDIDEKAKPQNPVENECVGTVEGIYKQAKHYNDEQEFMKAVMKFSTCVQNMEDDEFEVIGDDCATKS